MNVMGLLQIKNRFTHFERDKKACGKVKQLAAILKHAFRLHTEALHDPLKLAPLVNNKHVLLDMFGAFLPTAAATPVCDVACVELNTVTPKRTCCFESISL
jgi:hypothetical protein